MESFKWKFLAIGLMSSNSRLYYGCAVLLMYSALPLYND